MNSNPPMSRGQVRQGGKEELRASVLKTYLLRVRAEKGERAVRQLLAAAGIDPSAVDNETGWVSTLAAKRALRAVSQMLGPETIRHRGDWVTHPEALGTLVRMLRVAEHPVDAYRYLAANAKEVTRVGTWELEELGGGDGKQKAAIESVRMTYRPRDDGNDEPSEKADIGGEELLCSARHGELASLPRVWGLPEAIVTEEACIAKGAETCTYVAKWTVVRPRSGAMMGSGAAGIVCGGTVALAGNWARRRTSAARSFCARRATASSRAFRACGGCPKPSSPKKRASQRARRRARTSRSGPSFVRGAAR